MPPNGERERSVRVGPFLVENDLLRIILQLLLLWLSLTKYQIKINNYNDDDEIRFKSRIQLWKVPFYILYLFACELILCCGRIYFFSIFLRACTVDRGPNFRLPFKKSTRTGTPQTY